MQPIIVWAYIFILPIHRWYAELHVKPTYIAGSYRPHGAAQLGDLEEAEGLESRTPGQRGWLLFHGWERQAVSGFFFAVNVHESWAQ